jgi:hypothetical protein
MSETEKAPRKKRGKAPAVVDKPEAPKNDWRSQKYEIVPIDSVRPREDNANEGDKAAIGESVGANGFYGAILVDSDGRIVVGNHRWAELKAAGETECPVIRLSVEDERAIAIMIADNETRAGAKRNDNRMADLLARLPSHRGLGIKAPDVAALIERARPKVGYLDLMRANSDAAAADDGDPEEEPDEGDLPDDAEQDLTDFDDNDGGPRGSTGPRPCAVRLRRPERGQNEGGGSRPRAVRRRGADRCPCPDRSPRTRAGKVRVQTIGEGDGPATGGGSGGARQTTGRRLLKRA